jgi:hypothetical protein
LRGKCHTGQKILLTTIICAFSFTQYLQLTS